MQLETKGSIEVKFNEIIWTEEFPYKLLRRSPVSKDIKKLHFHNGIEIGYCYRGSGLFSVFNKIVPFSSGDVIVILPDQPHVAVNSDQDLSYWYFLNVDTNLLFKDMAITEYQPIADILTKKQNPPNILKNGKHSDIQEIVRQMFSEFDNQLPGYQFTIKALIWVFLLKISRLLDASDDDWKAFYESSNDFAIIAPAICYILSNYHVEITLVNLAKFCLLSKRNFSRMFEKVMRRTPYQYITQIRIRMATSLLRSTDIPITQIAMDVGYHSISSFNRFFIKLKKINPREYRKKYR